MNLRHPLRACLLVVLACAPLLAQADPSISSFKPIYGAPGDLVQIDGSGFSGTTIKVGFGGVYSTDAGATTPNQIQAYVPTGAKSGPISVQVDGGPVAYSVQDFTVIGVGPYIASFTPTNGAAGTLVTIKGAHFTTATGAYFNSIAGTNLFVQTDGSIQVYAPPGVTTGPITVRSPLGTNTSSGLFYTQPYITSFSPSFGRTGTNVIIRGGNLLGTTKVTLNGSNTTFLVLSNTALQMTVPPLATTGPLQVRGPGGSSPATTSNFVVKPVIYDFSPHAGQVGTTVVVSGANFNVGTPVVRFNNTVATYSSISFDQFTAKVPSGATTGPISINTTNGGYTNTVFFYITPAISSFTPTNAAPGKTVMITGSNFTDATNVWFGGVAAASFVVTNNTTIGAVVPAGVATGPVSVGTPGGIAQSSALFYGPPEIWSFNPTHGLIGAKVTVYGTNLLGAKALRFNGLDGTGLVATNNGFLTVTVPAGAQAGPLSVVTPAGTNTSAASFTLDYVDLVVKMSSQPQWVFTGSNFFYTITVSNKGPANAPDVMLTNTALASFELLSATASQGTVRTNPQPVVASLGSIPVAGTAELDLTYLYRGTGVVQSTATAFSSYSELVATDNTATVSMTVYPPAVLGILNQTNQMRLSWPLMLSNFTLQYVTGHISTNIWVSLIRPKTNTTTENVVTDTNLIENKFYRLKSP